MKRNLNLSIILAAAGLILSIILLIEHYYPDSTISTFFCGKDFINPCAEVSRSPWASILGIPLAAIGAAFYLTLCIIFLVADYAGGVYSEEISIVTLPLLCAALAADAVFGIMLISMGQFCDLCIATYIITALLLVLSFKSYRNAPQASLPYKERIKNYFAEFTGTSAKRGLSASLILLIFLSSAGSVLLDRSLHRDSGFREISSEEINAFIKSIELNTPEDIKFPESRIIIGDKNAPLTIHVFTDFLCSACLTLYKIEKRLLNNFKGQLKIIYYNYPLDSTCNRDVKRTIYTGACTASRAIIAAANTPYLQRYLIDHFRALALDKKHDYSEKKALALMKNISKTDTDMAALMQDEKVSLRLKRDIDLAISLKIDSTPTIFIDNRRIIGVPPYEYLEGLIKQKLSKKIKP